jgi:TrmH family RNA methyltransferase
MSPKTIQLRSRDDAFQKIESLRSNRKKRAQRRAFLVEGVRSINAMIESGWPVDAFVYAQDRALSDWAQSVLAKSLAERHICVPDEMMAELSDRTEPSELLAVAVIPEASRLEALPARDPALLVVADRPARPGNLGTLMRSCDALGADGLAILGHAADLYDPRTIRAAAGSWFAVSAATVASPRVLGAWFTALRTAQPDLQVVGTSAGGHANIGDHDFTKATVLLLGNEQAGLSQALRELSDTVVAIPIQGAASSLNMAAAASILLYEVARQRRSA